MTDLRTTIAAAIAAAKERARDAGRWDAAAVCCAGNSDSPCGWTAAIAYRLIGPPPPRWASLGPVLLAAADRLEVRR